MREGQTRAKDGDVEAMFTLGMTYEQGPDPVLVNAAEAYAWYTLAAAEGHPDALRRREALAGRMTAADLAWATTRIQELDQEIRSWHSVC